MLTYLLLVGIAADETLALRCTGPFTATVATSATTANASDNYGNQANGNSVTSERVTVDAMVEFRMSNGAATLRLPPIAYGSSNLRGARFEEKVDNLVVTDSQISGSARVSLLGKTRFRIDRITGTMTTSGGFRGECTPFDTAKRAF
ncbi:hypothetical protein [Sphingomonas sp. T9W2]|uniref:hypothetical protein n=1 Tax=Sphingomonas sp. T9W2 TaxID=3143183 RepID=UPI0031F52C55